MGTQAFWLSQSSSSFYVIEESEKNLVNCVAPPACEVDYEELTTPHKRVPIGQDFQAELPSQILTAPELESVKWLGEHIWPNLKKPIVTEKSTRSEKSSSFKAAYGMCCSTISGTIDSVKQHIEETRRALKDELGDAFYKWGFHEMGEIVAERWSEADELLFRQAVQNNPVSFWAELYKFFPLKDPKDLVSYYFNVFVLRKRAIQNRLDPNNVDSDDDEMWLDSDGQEDSFVDVPEVGDGPNGGNDFLKDYFDGIWDNIDELSSESGDDNLASQCQVSPTDAVQLENMDKQQSLSSECVNEAEDKENEFETVERNTFMACQHLSTNKDCEIRMLPCTAYSISEPQASVTSSKNVEKVVFTKESQRESISNDSQLSAPR